MIKDGILVQRFSVKNVNAKRHQLLYLNAKTCK